MPLGPIMELRAGGGDGALTAEQGAATVQRWQETLDRLRADPAAAASEEAMKA